MIVISSNSERNMREVVEGGITRHIPIDHSRPSRPKTNGREMSHDAVKMVMGHDPRSRYVDAAT